MGALIRPRLFAAPPSTLRINRQDPINADIVGRWPMNDAGGRLTMRDVSGGGFHGTLSASIGSSWTASPFQGMSFWKVITNDGVSINNLPALSVFTLAGRFFYNTSTASYQNLWTGGTVPGLWIKSDKLDWYTGTDHLSSATLVAGTVYSFCLTCAGVGGSNANLYINGALDTAGLPGVASATQVASTIAADTGSSGTGEVLQGGGLGDFVFSRRVWTVGEIERFHREPLCGIAFEPDRVLRALQGASATPLTADLSATLAAIALSADASVALQADLSKTLDAVTISAASSAALQAALSKTLDDVTLSASTSLPLVAVLTVTLDNVHLDSSAEPPGAPIGIPLDDVHVTAQARSIRIGKHRWLVRTAHIDIYGQTTIDNLRLWVKRGVGTYESEPNLRIRANRDNMGFGRWVSRGLGLAGDRTTVLDFGSFGTANTWQFEIEASEEVDIELMQCQALTTRLGH